MKNKLLQFLFPPVAVSKRINSFSEIMQVHIQNKPSVFKSLFSENLWRHQNFYESLQFLNSVENVKKIEQKAIENLSEWHHQKKESPEVIEVVSNDWGVTTFENTKKHGKIYTVLNMASADFPGGACFEGGSSQEENMWHRTTCVLSLLRLGVYYNLNDHSIRYEEYLKKLINAEVPMSNRETQSLSSHNNEKRFKVYLDLKPRVCFKGPEYHFTDASSELFSSKLRVDIENSYRFLDDASLFPFLEMRSAAPIFSNAKNQDNDRYLNDIRNKIAAQLDTLILNNQPYVILGAWGCGQYKNNPEIIARIYAEEISKRSNFFQHIVFSILNQGEKSSNFGVFYDNLSGMKLGQANKNDNPFDLKFK